LALENRTEHSRPYVLVVDDDADTRELYQLLLSSVGYTVESSGTVRAAAETIARTPPRVVITDWRLPDGDGFEVCDALRAHNASRWVPVVAVTGLTMQPPMIEEARARGCVSVIVKPVMPDDILAAVRAAHEIGTARQVRAAARRLLRYASQSTRHAERALHAVRTATIDAEALASRAAARSREDIAIVVADDSRHYVAAAGGTRALTGYEPRELVSLSVWDLTPPTDASAGEGLWSSFIAAGTQEGRYTLRRRDGAAVEAQYFAIANFVPGLHVSAIAEASQIPASL
jgi:CheY-like chemotaxis protein